MAIIGDNSRLLIDMMSAATQRHRVLAGNIANQNVPGYRRRDVRFEELMLKELNKARPDLSRVEPEEFVDPDAVVRPNGNSVELEQEVVAQRENKILYDLYTEILRGQMGLVRTAIESLR